MTLHGCEGDPRSFCLPLPTTGFIGQRSIRFYFPRTGAQQGAGLTRHPLLAQRGKFCLWPHVDRLSKSLHGPHFLHLLNGD